jgi:NAD(P)-dependent dehydrogenase (short-subunit alcohol dehydrogenase family)
MSGSKTVLITGAGGGLGGTTAALFADRGWTVYAADLRAPAAGPNIIPVEMDVTDPDSCGKAAAAITATTDGLDAVINFAGVLQVGTPLAELAPAKMKLTLDVNVFGTYLVNHTMFDLVRARKGRIVNISSEAGRFKPLGFGGPYSVSKHAVEAYSDVLRRELMFLGIPVVIVQPGAFRTAMTGSINTLFSEAKDPDSPLARQVGKVAKSVAGRDQKARDPRLLAEVVWTATTAKKPRRRYRAHHDRASAAISILPDGLVDRLMRQGLG